LPDDERVAGGLNYFACDGGELVDVEDPGDLGEQALHEAEVAVGDARDGGDGFGVGEVLGAEREAEALPVVGEDEEQFVGASDSYRCAKPMRLYSCG